MLMDKRDLDLLRLLGLCKDIPADCSPLKCDMFSNTELLTLSGAGYIRKSKNGLSYRLTDKGYALLSACGVPVERDKYPVGNSGTLRRRLEAAKTVLTMYRAEIEVFVETGEPIYTPAFMFRRKSRGQLLGAARLCGICQKKTQSIFVYFITGQTVLNEGVELAAIEKLTVLLKLSPERVVLSLGDNQDVLKQFVSPLPFRDRRSLWGDTLSNEVGWDLYEPPSEPLVVSIYA